MTTDSHDTPAANRVDHRGAAWGMLLLACAACATAPEPAHSSRWLYRAADLGAAQVLGPAGLRIEVLATGRSREFHEALRATAEASLAARTTVLPMEGVDPAAMPAVLRVHVVGDRVERDVSEHTRAPDRPGDPAVETIEYRTSRIALVVYELLDANRQLVALFSDDAVASEVRAEDAPDSFDVPVLDLIFTVADFFTESHDAEFPAAPGESKLVARSSARFWTELLDASK